MSQLTPFVRVPGDGPYADYNTDRGRKEALTADACWLLVDSYDGELDDNGRFHGPGSIRYASGIVYNGDFSHGQGSGRGKIIWPGGSVYEGEVRGGQPDGEGTLDWADGSTYEGFFVTGRREGFGVMTASNGVRYEGHWRGGLRHGEGRLIYGFVPALSDTEEDVINEYVGRFANGRRSGFGMMRYASGALYEGGWSADKKHGNGVMVWPRSGEAYEGGWVDDMPSGEGVHVWERPAAASSAAEKNTSSAAYAAGMTPPGTAGMLRAVSGATLGTYEQQAGLSASHSMSEASLSTPHSPMVLQDADDRSVSAQSQGFAVGNGTAGAGTVSSGNKQPSEASTDTSRTAMLSRYEGSMLQGQRHGVGTFYYSDGSRYTGTWRVGLKHGLGVMVYADGSVYEGVFVSDRPRDLSGAASVSARTGGVTSSSSGAGNGASASASSTGKAGDGDGVAMPSARTAQRQASFAMHLDDVLTGAPASGKAKTFMVGPAGAALAGRGAARRAAGAGAGVLGSTALSLASAKDSFAVQSVLGRWLPQLRRWYTAGCVEGEAERCHALELGDDEPVPHREQHSHADGGAMGLTQADATPASDDHTGGGMPSAHDVVPVVPGLALQALATVGEDEEEEEEEEDDEDNDTGSSESNSKQGRERHTVTESKETEDASSGKGQEQGSLKPAESSSADILASLTPWSEPPSAFASAHASPRRSEATASARLAGQQLGVTGNSSILAGAAHKLIGKRAAPGGGTGIAVSPRALVSPRAGDGAGGGTGGRASVDPIASASSGVFAMPQRGLWRAVRAMGLLRPPASQVVVDRVLALVRLRHARRALGGLAATAYREFGILEATNGDVQSGSDRGVDARTVTIQAHTAGGPSSLSEAATAASVVDTTLASPTAEEWSTLRGLLAGHAGGARHDPSRPVLFREFLEVCVRLCRMLYSAGRRPPSDATAIEAAGVARTEAEAEAMEVWSAAEAEFKARLQEEEEREQEAKRRHERRQRRQAGAVSPSPTSRSVAGSVSGSPDGSTIAPPSTPLHALPGSASTAAGVVTATVGGSSPSMSHPAQPSPGDTTRPGTTASSVAGRGGGSRGGGSRRSARARQTGTDAGGRTIGAAATSASSVALGKRAGTVTLTDELRRPPRPSRAVPASSLAYAVDCALWYRAVPAAATLGVAPLPGTKLSRGLGPTTVPVGAMTRPPNSAPTLRSLLIDHDAVAHLDPMAPALREVFERYSSPDEGSLVVPTSVDPGSSQGLGSAATSSVSANGRVMSVRMLLRLLHDAGLIASDFGSAHVAQLVERCVYDAGRTSAGRAVDLGATGMALPVGAEGVASASLGATTGLVVPRHEAEEDAAAAEAEAECVSVMAGGLVLVPAFEADSTVDKSDEADIPAEKDEDGDVDAREGVDPVDIEEALAAPVTAVTKSSSSMMGVEFGIAEFPLVLCRVMAELLRRAPGRSVAAKRFSSTVTRVRVEVEAEAEAKEQLEQEEIAKAAAEAAAGGGKGGKKGASKAKGKAKVDDEEAAATAAAEAAAVEAKAKARAEWTRREISRRVGATPALPLVLPGCAVEVPATDQELRDTVLLGTGVPVRHGGGLGLAAKLERFLGSVLLRRLGVAGYTEAFTKTSPQEEGAGNLTGRSIS